MPHNAHSLPGSEDHVGMLLVSPHAQPRSPPTSRTRVLSHTHTTNIMHTRTVIAHATNIALMRTVLPCLAQSFFHHFALTRSMHSHHRHIRYCVQFSQPHSNTISDRYSRHTTNVPVTLHIQQLRGNINCSITLFMSPATILL